MSTKRIRSTPSSGTYNESLMHGIDSCFVVNRELLLKYGVSNQIEADAINGVISTAHKYGCEALSHGLSNLFNGMDQAVVAFSEMKYEIQTLHQGILVLRKEVSDTRDLLYIAETTASQKMEVSFLNACTTQDKDKCVYA